MNDIYGKKLCREGVMLGVALCGMCAITFQM